MEGWRTRFSEWRAGGCVRNPPLRKQQRIFQPTGLAIGSINTLILNKAASEILLERGPFGMMSRRASRKATPPGAATAHQASSGEYEDTEDQCATAALAVRPEFWAKKWRTYVLKPPWFRSNRFGGVW